MVMQNKDNKRKSKDEQIRELRERLAEAESNLEAIISGKADAIVIQNESGFSVFTIQGAETAYRIMVDTMNEGAITVDSEGVILYANTRFCNMLNSPCENVVGKLIQDFIVKEKINDIELFLKKTVAGSNVHQDFEFTKRDSSVLPVYLSSAPLEILGRKDICIVASDLTERKMAQLKLMELNNSLEIKVKDRTFALEKQKIELENSQQELQKLTASLEQQIERRTTQVRELAKALTLAEQRQRQQLSNVLHEDLQQTLFATKMRFDLLRDVLREGKETEVDSDITTLEQLTSKALDTSKRLAIEFNPPILKSEGLDAALKWLAFHFQQNYNLKIDVCVSDNFRIINEEERILLVQLVRELLMNIVKHAKTDAANIEVSRDQKHILIVVEDKGVGFEMGIIKDAEHGNIHLGLFSIEERLRLFGGDLTIESKKGKGTKILMKLPFDSEIQQLSVE